MRQGTAQKMGKAGKDLTWEKTYLTGRLPHFTEGLVYVPRVFPLDPGKVSPYRTGGSFNSVSLTLRLQIGVFLYVSWYLST